MNAITAFVLLNSNRTLIGGGLDAKTTQQISRSFSRPTVMAGSIPNSVLPESSYQFDDLKQLQRMIHNRTKLNIIVPFGASEPIQAHYNAYSPPTIIFNLRINHPITFRKLNKDEKEKFLFQDANDLPYSSTDIAKLCGISTPLLPIFDNAPIYIVGQCNKEQLRESLAACLGATLKDNKLEFNVKEFKKRLLQLNLNSWKPGKSVNWIIAYKHLAMKYVPDDVLSKGYNATYKNLHSIAVRVDTVNDLGFQELSRQYIYSEWLKPSSSVRDFTIENFNVQGPYGIHWSPGTGAMVVVKSKDSQKYPDLICSISENHRPPNPLN